MYAIFFFFQAEDGIRDLYVTGVQTCALPISISRREFVKATALAPLAVAPFSLGPQTSKEDRFDIVVAGAGHNRMIAAAYLAQAGYKCLVLEGRAPATTMSKRSSLEVCGPNENG